MKQVPREVIVKYKKVINYLFKEGFTPDEIATLSWGRVDECKSTITVKRCICTYKIDLKTGKVDGNKRETEKKLNYRGSGFERFFRSSPMYSKFVFTRERFPKYSDEKSSYSADQIRSFITDIADSELRIDKNTNILTKVLEFGNIKVAKVNINEKMA